MYKVQFDTIRNVLKIDLKKVFSENDAISLYQDVQKNIHRLDKNCNLLTDLTQLDLVDDNAVQHIKHTMDIINEHGVVNIYRVLPENNKNFGFNIMSMFHYSKKIKFKTFTSLEEANNYLMLNTRRNIV